MFLLFYLPKSLLLSNVPVISSPRVPPALQCSCYLISPSPCCSLMFLLSHLPESLLLSNVPIIMAYSSLSFLIMWPKNAYHHHHASFQFSLQVNFSQDIRNHLLFVHDVLIIIP
ncbi:hypothetical protein BsWGS_07977 [Bradybaena similaris]